MFSLHYITIMFLSIAAGLQAMETPKKTSAKDGRWFIKAVNTPQNIAPLPGSGKVVIAVVDDGVRITHDDLKDFIWINPKEIPNNGVDDDGNGYADDIHGFDVSDDNNTVSPPDKRPKDFYHGTHIAGAIAQIAKTVYGNKASDVISIMSVKALSDTAQHAYIKDGYKGIEYAIEAGADIIVCAWGVGHISPDESKTLQRAYDKGILILASAGNFPEGQEKYPAAHETVLAIGALDQNDLKSANSNFGSFVDLSAPGVDIESAASFSDTAYEFRDGSSMATAIAAAGAAILKSQNPAYTQDMLRACLKNSADNIAAANSEYTAQTGAGKLNITAAIDCKLFKQNVKKENVTQKPQGYIRAYNRSNNKTSWTIKPHGTFKGIWFRSIFTKNTNNKSIVKFYSDSSPAAKLYGSYTLDQLPAKVFVPGTTAYVTCETKEVRSKTDLLMEFRAEAIDFSRLYCCDTVKLDTEGTFVDGSGENNYSNKSDCKWLITAPAGKVIHIKFTEFDTQAKTDFVYFFNGTGTHEKIMAIFSGPDIPPEIVTWTNQVLVWFVTDTKIQGKGFKAEYRFVDP
ncbi:MAG: S8 family serine peptidase [Anaerohalosphaera sp.]|nr:S8 family serine peptidase [Anaerohalosphaera sp.]